MIITSAVIPLPVENVDTDQIIPARFLLGVTKVGFGDNLFADQKADSAFVMNQPEMAGRQILVAGHNFGCGSSREHAAWAVDQAGIKVIISSLFSDIFKSNAFKNGLLPITVSPAELAQLFAELAADPAAELTVDIAAETLTFPSGYQHTFQLEPFRKKQLLAEQGDMEYLLSKEAEIAVYEIKMNK